jgi:hypothetical protein
MTKDQQQQTTVDDDQKPGLVGNDHTTLVDLRMQRATQMLRPALQLEDDDAFEKAATAALAEVDRSVDSIDTTGTAIDRKALTPTVEFQMITISEVLDRCHVGGTPAPRFAGVYSLSHDVLKRFSKQWDVRTMKMRSSEPHARQLATELSTRANATKNGLGELSVSEKATLGRMFIRASEQLVLEGWSNIVEGRG